MENYEQKYKEALDRCKRKYEFAKNEGANGTMVWMEEIFPELKESEDEKIIKALINVFSTHKDYEVFYGVSVEDILAWLEKQGEQKSEEVNNLHNYLYDEQNPADEVGNYDHKKVLQTIINEQNPVDNQFTPEQANLLDKHIDKFLEQKPAWSEEDEETLKAICTYIQDYPRLSKITDIKRFNEYTDWLKSLKERYTWKPSDEQMEFLWKYAEQNNYDGTILTSLFRDLKKLK